MFCHQICQVGSDLIIQISDLTKNWNYFSDLVQLMSFMRDKQMGKITWEESRLREKVPQFRFRCLRRKRFRRLLDDVWSSGRASQSNCRGSSSRRGLKNVERKWKFNFRFVATYIKSRFKWAAKVKTKWKVTFEFDSRNITSKEVDSNLLLVCNLLGKSLMSLHDYITLKVDSNEQQTLEENGNLFLGCQVETWRQSKSIKWIHVDTN